MARELERQPYDLVVMHSQPQKNVDLAEAILQAGEHHLLLVPRPQPSLEHVLICVAAGEPGKEDVLFAGRLARHLGASATLLSVLPRDGNQAAARARDRARMIVRARRGKTSVAKAPDHERHFQTSVIPELKRIDGLLGATLKFNDNDGD